MYPRNTKPTPSYFGCQSQPPGTTPSFAAQWLFGHWKDCGIVKIFPTRHRSRGGHGTGGGERGRVQLPPWGTHVTLWDVPMVTWKKSWESKAKPHENVTRDFFLRPKISWGKFYVLDSHDFIQVAWSQKIRTPGLCFGLSPFQGW